jgi:hypothetical protein
MIAIDFLVLWQQDVEILLLYHELLSLSNRINFSFIVENKNKKITKQARQHLSLTYDFPLADYKWMIFVERVLSHHILRLHGIRSLKIATKYFGLKFFF